MRTSYPHWTQDAIQVWALNGLSWITRPLQGHQSRLTILPMPKLQLTIGQRSEYRSSTARPSHFPVCNRKPLAKNTEGFSCVLAKRKNPCQPGSRQGKISPEIRSPSYCKWRLRFWSKVDIFAKYSNALHGNHPRLCNGRQDFDVWLWHDPGQVNSSPKHDGSLVSLAGQHFRSVTQGGTQRSSIRRPRDRPQKTSAQT